MITKEKKAAIIKEYGLTEGDTGSPEVQVAILTARIAELTEHLKVNKFAEVIPEDLEKLNTAGDAIWTANYLTHEVLHVNFRRKQ